MWSGFAASTDGVGWGDVLALNDSCKIGVGLLTLHHKGTADAISDLEMDFRAVYRLYTQSLFKQAVTPHKRIYHINSDHDR